MRSFADLVLSVPIINLLQKKGGKMCEKTELLSFKTIPVDQAVGTTLAHDMMEIIPGRYKGPAFKKGHKVKSEDLCRLMRMGKNNLYVLD